LYYLFDLCLEERPKIIVELGMGMGYSTRVLGMAAMEISGRVWSVDNFSWGAPNQGVIEKVQALGLPVDFIAADSLVADVPHTIDLLFIDTSHAYAQTLAELTRYASWMTSHGIMLVHDIMQGPPCGPEERLAIGHFLRSPAGEGWKLEVVPIRNGFGKLYR
jgi:predicted O-methyltransferase YrrM